MTQREVNTHPRPGWLARITVAALLVLTAPAGALERLSNEDMASVNGGGLALGIENLRMLTSSSGYIEALGEDKDYSGDPFQRADVRWYGVSISAASGNATGTGETYSGSDCGGNNLQCPISANGVLIPDDNPFVLRAWDYTGTSTQGHRYLTYDGSTSGVPTVFELLFPEWHENLKVSFWGEIGVGLNNGIAPEGGSDNPAASSPGNPSSGPFLQSRTILDDVDLAGSRIRWFRFSDPADPTFGLATKLKITGDMHFSVQQGSASADQIGIVPDFASNEGLYFKNVDTYLPIGMLHYQAMTANQVPGGGDFILEVGPIPGTPGDGTNSLTAVQKDFYALREDSNGNVNEDGYAPISQKPSRWHETHGHWKIGTPGNQNNQDNATAYHSSADGVFFRGTANYTAHAERPSQNSDLDADSVPRVGYTETVGQADDYTTNLGDVNVEGLLMHQLSVTTCATVNGAC